MAHRARGWRTGRCARLVTAGLLLVSAAACATSSPTVPPPGSESSASSQPPATPVGYEEAFQLRVGQVQAVGPDGLELRFERVTSDSRCPVNVTCVWEGDAIVLVTVRRPRQTSAALELHTQANSPRELMYREARVRLVHLVPQPVENMPVPQSGYLATFMVAAR